MNKMDEKTMNCPNGHGKMLLRKTDERMKFRDVNITYQAVHCICPVCGVEAGTVNQTAETQKAIADAYRKAMNLLTSEEIREGRKRLGLSQETLAKRMNVGIASIKRWEGGLIQTRSMDKALRLALREEIARDRYTGNRHFSKSRIKLVLRQFESILGRRILKKRDKMLFEAKYLWYADMVAFRELGESMTGSTYAALPYGPQLNNYRDLIDEIKNANELSAEPLKTEEKRIIRGIARAFPEDRMVYNAAHKEKIWKEKTSGAIIPYSDSAKLTGL
jgi:putative zinc finger/helix-turn-helix YgiT family protein